MGKIMLWNKGNARFAVKKMEVEVILEKHKPLILGLLEANMGANSFHPSLTIDGYSLERDNLADIGLKTRTAVFIRDGVSYTRRTDLEIRSSPTIWLEMNQNSPSPWLIFCGYREWCTLERKGNKESRTILNQTERLLRWQEMWRKAEQENKPMYLFGDMNLDVSSWTHPGDSQTPYQVLMQPLLNLLKEMADENQETR